MSHEALFLRASLANPQDDVPRLQFADWLDEQGDPRGEFIRLQVELSRRDPDEGRRRLQEEQRQALLAALAFAPEFSPATRWTNAIGMAYVLVPRGTFWMGGGGGTPGDRQVEIPHPFYVSVYPCTQGQWQAVMGNNPSYFSRTGRKKQVQTIAEEDLTRFPVERVSWEDVQTFVAKLNEQDPYSGWEYRLPTEAEWEYVCRGGATSKEECSFHFYFEQPTNNLSSLQANFKGTYTPDGREKKGPYLKRPTRVGSYPPNRLGVYDLHGNVWEWCQDLYIPGSYGRVILDTEESNSRRVIRGGSWFSQGNCCQAAFQYGFEPSVRYHSLGFRLVLFPFGS